MSHRSAPSSRRRMVVLSAVEQWSSLKALLQDGGQQIAFSSVGSKQACDLTLEGHSLSLHHAELQEDMTEEATRQALDGCFQSCSDGLAAFLLLIPGGRYADQESRMVEVLQAHFGAQAFRFLVLLSVEDGSVVDTLADALLDLIQVCGGRFCRVTPSAASDGLRSLLKMVDSVLSEDGVTGYTDAMLAAAKKRSSERSAANIIRKKLQEAQGKERAFKQRVEQREAGRARQVEELRAKHAEERKEEAAEKQQHEARRQSLEEALMSHRSMLQLQMAAPDGEEAQRTCVILVGLSGSGKSSALSLILQRAGHQYSFNEPGEAPPPPSSVCERQEVFAGGRQLILVDTPELWDEDGLEDVELVKDCLALALPGPHVFLVVLQVGRFTQGESDMLGQLQRVFGREFAEHAVVLFVQLDCSQHRPQTIEQYVGGAHPSLQDLVRKCGSRYYELNITPSQNALSYPQVRDLLSGVNKLVASHGGQPYAGRRFSVQELQDRRAEMEDRKEGGWEDNFLLRED